ncbi:GNAT family N-acetyltransferase [Histomonas meleagridis]|uniref:GNAT family N-acetyltransferase n=1 Tax=Histomonas meleagridis TaxID=135588 RepID=UPI00355A342B|nr:GNAT family N-acetyltransferase [Histomonas meleagridis]KAH0805879.1 GNAT family N-acetyltransferase [Histomonas meleagridis]
MIKKSIVPIKDNINDLANFAKPILLECYERFFKPGVTIQWVNNNQSAEAIKRDIKDGMEYYYIKSDNEVVGYFAIKPDNKDLLLSKLYIDKKHRGKGFGKYALDFANNYGKEKNLQNVYCYCADYNTKSLEIYDKLGFKEKGDYIYKEKLLGEIVAEREIILEKPIL